MTTRETVVQAFEGRWNHIHAMTLAFVECVPDEHWHASPHAGFAPFAKQLRHVVCVRGVYNAGLESRRIDFGSKHSHYGGGLTRRELTEALVEKHEALLTLLPALPDDVAEPCIDFFGMRVSYADYLYGYVQHEAIHHGQWSLYAAAGGYATPELWRVQWGLGAAAV